MKTNNMLTKAAFSLLLIFYSFDIHGQIKDQFTKDNFKEQIILDFDSKGIESFHSNLLEATNFIWEKQLTTSQKDAFIQIVNWSV